MTQEAKEVGARLSATWRRRACHWRGDPSSSRQAHMLVGSGRALTFIAVRGSFSPPRLRSPSCLYRQPTTMSRSSASLSTSVPPHGSPATLRVCTYNCLSSHLGGPDWFTACHTDDLKPSTRLQRLLAKLEVEIAKDAVICLQEVSMTWSGTLVSFFAQRGYQWVGHLYGEFRNNYMGVGIAWPSRRWIPTDVNIVRVGDTLPRIRAPPRPKGFAGLVARLRDTYARVRQALTGDRPPMDDWTASQRRFNALVVAHLRCVRSGVNVAVACYHMPCAYYQPGLMTIHAAAAAQKSITLAGSTPLVLCGDWNIKPDSAQYAMLTTGALDVPTGHPALPVLPAGMAREAFKFTVPKQLRSAYAESHAGQEPDWTNWAVIKEQPEFIETLDYIFVTSDIQVLSADDLPHRSTVQGPLPNATEPSDHIMVCADLRVYPPEGV